MAKCRNCGKWYLRLGEEKFCSTTCAFEYEKKEAERNKGFIEVECRWCKKKYIPSNGLVRFCCPECADDYRDATREIKMIYKSSVVKALNYAKENPREENKEILKRFKIQ